MWEMAADLSDSLLLFVSFMRVKRLAWLVTCQRWRVGDVFLLDDGVVSFQRVKYICLLMDRFRSCKLSSNWAITRFMFILNSFQGLSGLTVDEVQ